MGGPTVVLALSAARRFQPEAGMRCIARTRGGWDRRPPPAFDFSGIWWRAMCTGVRFVRVDLQTHRLISKPPRCRVLARAFEVDPGCATARGGGLWFCIHILIWVSVCVATHVMTAGSPRSATLARYSCLDVTDRTSWWCLALMV